MPSDGNLYDAVRRTGGTLLGALQTRVELALLELGEAGGRLLGAFLVGLLGLLLVATALFGLSAALVIAWWPTHGIGGLVAVAIANAVLGAVLLAWMRRALRRRPPLLEASLKELQRDAALLQGTRHDPPSPSSAASRRDTARR